MASITKSEVARLASLSKVSLTAQQTENLRADLEAIVSYIDQLSALDTEGVEPTYQISGLHNVWRQDKLTNETLPRESLLSLASSQADHQIKVPKVL